MAIERRRFSSSWGVSVSMSQATEQVFDRPAACPMPGAPHRRAARRSVPAVQAAIHVVVDQTQLAQWALFDSSILVVAATMEGAGDTSGYCRKATAIVAGEAHRAGGDVLIAARPSVRAVGIFRLRFGQDGGSWLRLTEIERGPDSLVSGRQWDQPISVFGAGSFVEAGETLTTTVVFDVGRPDEAVLGWRLSFGISVGRFRKAQDWAWADRMFIPVPIAVSHAAGGHGASSPFDPGERASGEEGLGT